ncbi:OmpA family protein [Olleya aquimaris]|uniref:Outer membrane protein OmpA-like peptidoglycan-associated protein n=1 Tax=Olleya aquimaris TaxID=639310 RepID=A0A327R7Z8_9FLAO|nr:OmpA family protein [Olleya aquimaris]RAJ12082.1 outer membrane protein OmpA-like peptidoglycan-associated protein [Olleya aquimaris]
MSKKTGYLLGILITIILGTILYWFFCCKPCLETQSNTLVTTPEAEDTQVDTIPTPVTIKTFKIMDADGDLDFNIYENLNFKTSSASILTPVSAAVDSSATILANYYLDNPSKLLDIYGHYRSDESNNSVFPTLGLARANSAKNYLVSKGMLSKTINTYGRLDDNFNPDLEGVLHGPLSYVVNTLVEGDTSGEAEMKQLGSTIKANPLVLYFDTAQASINLTDSQREKVANMIRYIDHVEGASITVIGHTDNTGSRITNTRLGLNRANFAKNYLVQNGISADQIITTSKGPDQPIADNSTEAGKAKNRRVVVTIN